ncbi:PAS domain-containing protein [Desulfospira joergensenii]|uniref:PAS domain-containing protein n=1 Tax=Desulfospira joergensenii TaxID=53329 RepID=UPI0003B3E772|nr:PAS domain-containing protein [Desulfospira joergensenii]
MDLKEGTGRKIRFSGKVPGKLKEGNDFSSVVLNHTGDGVLALTLEGEILYANPAAMNLFDLSLENLNARPILESISPDQHRYLPGFLIHPGSGLPEKGEAGLVRINTRNLIFKFIPMSAETLDWILLIIHEIRQEDCKTAEKTSGPDRLGALRGLIPICASCRRIRNPEGLWDPMETFIQKHSDAVFSHGICPECSRLLYGSHSEIS